MTTRAPIARASVCAGDITTDYWRAGVGDVVILLGASRDAEPRDVLIDALSRTHRVVVPDLPAERGVGFSDWLRDFLDGLGAVHASIIARDAFALSTLAFALSDADRVQRLVLLLRDGPDSADDTEVLAAHLEGVQSRLLVVREQPDPESSNGIAMCLEAIARFLA